MDYRLPDPSDYQRRIHLSPVTTSPQSRNQYSVDHVIAEFREACQPPLASHAPVVVPDNMLTSEPSRDSTLSSSWNWESGRRYQTRAGFRVRSKAEKIIADFLTIEGFDFRYEPLLEIGTQRICPDFYLTEFALPYEHFGLNTPDYLSRAELKIARYVHARQPFIYTTFNDETDLEEILTDKIFLAAQT